MDARKILLLAILAIILVAAAFLGNWVWTTLTSGPTGPYPGEIRTYDGLPLGEINDFRLEAINGIQNINVNFYQLVVTGLVQNQTVYTYDEIINNHTSYEKVVTLHCVEGWAVTALWRGVLVKDLLEEAGYNHSATVVIFYAQDGYTTALPLSYIVNRNIMIAYKINNVTLPPREGYPFQLVAEGKLGYKWIKWITRMEVSNNTDFLGYWETYGFDNNADVP